MKRFALVLSVLALGLSLASGCSSPGKIDPDGIADLVSFVCARHDFLVRGGVRRDEPSLRDARGNVDADKVDSALDSSAILLKTVRDAQKVKHGE